MSDQPNGKDKKCDTEQWLNVRVQGRVTLGHETQTDDHADYSTAPHEQPEPPVSLWQRILKPFCWARDAAKRDSDLITALATAFIGAFTIALWVVSYRQTKDSEIIQRAYVNYGGTTRAVFVDPKVQKVTGWIVFPQWANSGETPTRHLTMHDNTNEHAVKDYPSNDFFNDQWNANVALKDRKQIPMLIGPKGTVNATGLWVPVEELLHVKAGTDMIYIWGWAKYHDVFKGTPEHITRFCERITGVLGDPADADLTKSFFTTESCPKGVCADEECND